MPYMGDYSPAHDKMRKPYEAKAREDARPLKRQKGVGLLIILSLAGLVLGLLL